MQVTTESALLNTQTTSEQVDTWNQVRSQDQLRAFIDAKFDDLVMAEL